METRAASLFKWVDEDMEKVTPWLQIFQASHESVLAFISVTFHRLAPREVASFLQNMQNKINWCWSELSAKNRAACKKSAKMQKVIFSS